MSRRSVRIYGPTAGMDADDTIASVSNSNLHVAMGDSPSLDAFSRMRVSQPVTIFDSILKYDKRDDLWYEQLTGGATSIHSFDNASIVATVTTSGDKVVRQSRLWTRYQPGKSQLTLMTFNLVPPGSPTTGVRRRVGHFNEDNGVYFEQRDGVIAWVKRSNTSGTPVESRIEQADWNLDKFADLDTSKTQILVVDLQWLGVGRVRVGFDVDGVIRYVHEFLHANIETTVYMTTAQLPLRYELEAITTPQGPASMRIICSMVSSEGGVQLQLGVPHTANSGAPASSSGTLIPLLSIRPKTTFQGEINRIQTIQRSLQVLNTGNGTAEVHLIWDGVLTGAAFASVEADSTMEFDTAATAITGGHDVQSFYVSATNQADASLIADIVGGLTLTNDIAGINPTPLTIAITNHGNITAAAAMSWQEYL